MPAPALLMMLLASATAPAFAQPATPAARTAPARPSPPVGAIVKLDSGMTLDYVVQGDPRGEVLLLLHGAGDSWHSWDRVMPLLPATYRVYAITQRGHGRSDHPATGFHRDDFASGVRGFLSKLGIKKVTIVGHSLGSLIAQAVAEQDTAGAIARVVLIGSGPGVRDGQVREAISSPFAGLKDPIDYTFARDFQMSTIHHPVPALFAELMIGEAMKVPAATWHGLAEFHAETRRADELKAIKAPTIIFWGDQDSIFTRADQDVLTSMIPRAKLHVYKDTGHALHWERPREFVADLLRDLR